MTGQPVATSPVVRGGTSDGSDATRLTRAPVALAEGVEVVQTDAGTLVRDERTGRYTRITPTGARLLALLDGEATPDDLVTRIAGGDAAQETRIRPLVIAFLRQLDEAGVLTVSDAALWFFVLPMAYVDRTDTYGLPNALSARRHGDRRSAGRPLRRAGPEPAATLLGNSAQSPMAGVVLATAIERLAAKYGPLAYRIAHLDAGAALAQLRLVADAFGWTHRLVRRPEDDTALAAGLRPAREPITAVCMLGGGG